MLKKRSCIRFHVPGATLCYRKKPRFWRKNGYSRDWLPVLDISRGGAKFLSNNRLKVGLGVEVQIHIPEEDQILELAGVVRWVGRNTEASYRFQTGISFAPYGSRGNENPPEILDQIKQLETTYSTETEFA